MIVIGGNYEYRTDKRGINFPSEIRGGFRRNG